MKKYLLSIWLAIFLVKPTIVEAKNLSNVSGRITAYLSDGSSLSGTAFKYRGKIVTAGHFCAGWADAKATNSVSSIRLYFRTNKGIATGGEYIPRRWAYDATQDVCELTPLYPANDTLKNLTKGTVKVGDEVSIVGSPLGLDGPYRTDGYVAHLSDPRVGGFMTISAGATGGNSGSPVLNKQGKLVGILVAGATHYPHISICVPVKALDELLDIK